MDGDAGGRGDVTFAGPGGGRSPRPRRPVRRGTRYPVSSSSSSLEGGEGLGEEGRSEEDRPRRRIIRLVRPGLAAW